MDLLISKNKIIASEVVKTFRNMKANMLALKSDGDDSHYSKETSLVILDICDIAERIYSRELTIQQAADHILGVHYERTKYWDELSQEFTDSVVLSIMFRFFGKPINSQH